MIGPAWEIEFNYLLKKWGFFMISYFHAMRSKFIRSWKLRHTIIQHGTVSSRIPCGFYRFRKCKKGAFVSAFIRFGTFWKSFTIAVCAQSPSQHQFYTIGFAWRWGATAYWRWIIEPKRKKFFGHDLFCNFHFCIHSLFNVLIVEP